MAALREMHLPGPEHIGLDAEQLEAERLAWAQLRTYDNYYRYLAKRHAQMEALVGRTFSVHAHVLPRARRRELHAGIKHYVLSPAGSLQIDKDASPNLFRWAKMYLEDGELEAAWPEADA